MNGLLFRAGVFFFVFSTISLTTQAKIVTYTPCPCSRAAQYSSQDGRRVVSSHRSASEKKAVLAQRAVLILKASPKERHAYLLRPEPIPSFILTRGVTPLRSPPFV